MGSQNVMALCLMTGWCFRDPTYLLPEMESDYSHACISPHPHYHHPQVTSDNLMPAYKIML